jgi:signal transduction histidine kinase
MPVTSSLSNRIFFACTLLAMLSLGSAFYFVNARATSEAEAELRRGLTESGILVDQNRVGLTDTFMRLARLVADGAPKLKAAVETGDPPTVQPLADEYRDAVNADLLLLTGRRGMLLGASGPGAAEIKLPATLRDPGSLDEVSTFVAHPRGVLQVVSVPIVLGGDPPDVLGRLTIGFFLDDRFAEQIKRLTGSEIAFGAGGRILASTLPESARPDLARVMGASDIATVTIGDEDFLALARPLVPRGQVQTAGIVPIALTLRSRTERLRFLNTIRTGLEGALIITLLLATIVSYAVARTMTRPLSAITSAMRDVAATGDLTRKVALRSRPWDDEDARLLAGAFNTLTDSIARFQAEAAQRERLSSLGRLSTVIAHEIRNPLMIIKAALRSLKRDVVKASELREAVADIDDETTRLNRIVTEVLDFAKPIRFDFAQADINDICRASSTAAWAGADATGGALLDLEPSLPHVVTDAERLRTALVNILANARHAVQAADAAAEANPERPAPPTDVGVTLRTRSDEHGRVTVAIQDRGVGIAPEDMAHIFDPFFTTRRAGTGIGLPISKNIIEGMGGTLAVASQRGVGTEFRIELPLQPPEVHA